MYKTYNKANDISMGLTNESKVYNKLKNLLCPKYGENDIIKTTDQYAKWDWTGDINGTHFEMKSRRNTKKCYPTTLLPVHKILKTDVAQVFIFHFTDKTCYIEYNEDLFICNSLFKEGLHNCSLEIANSFSCENIFNPESIYGHQIYNNIDIDTLEKHIKNKLEKMKIK